MRRRLALWPWLMVGTAVALLALIVLLGRGVDLPDLAGLFSPR